MDAAVASSPETRGAGDVRRGSTGRAASAFWWDAGGALAGTVVAIVLRCWRVASVPPGFYVDEVLTARNALAWRLDPHASLFGSRPLLVPGWVETSNLYLAFASTVMRLAGDGLVAVRMFSVLPSLAAVPLVYVLGRQLAGRRTGWLAALLFAASHWAARSGRTGWDAVLMVTLELGALVCLVAAVQSSERQRRLAWSLAGGALLGLALSTYVAARLVVLHAASWLGWEALAAGRARRAPASGAAPRDSRALVALLVSLGAAALVAAPWLAHSLEGRGLVPLRARQLSVFALREGEAWATLARNAVAHLGMFHVRGGAYARDDLPGFPMLDPVTGALLLAGVVVVVRATERGGRLLVSWPLVLGLGGVLSVSGEGPPYPYRVLALAPWACLVAGVGGGALWDLARQRLSRRARVALATVGLAAVVAVNAWVLFVCGPADADTVRVYGTAPTRLGWWLRDHAAGRPVLVLDGALAPPPESDSPYAAANRTSFFRDVDTIAAIQLAAGVYRRDPARSLDPMGAAGDVDRAAALPADLSRPMILVVSDAQAAEAIRRFRVERDVTLRYADGTPLARVAFTLPEPR